MGHTSQSGIETRLHISERDSGLFLRLSKRVGLASTITESFLYGLSFGLIPALIVFGTSNLPYLATVGLFGAVLFGSVSLVYFLDTKWRDKKAHQLMGLADRLTSIAKIHNKSALDEKIEPLLNIPDEETEAQKRPESKNRLRS